MPCPRCGGAVESLEVRCPQCGANLAVGTLEVVRGQVPDRSFPLSSRTYTVGRARQNDICLPEPSVSKFHARLVHEDGRFVIEDQGSLHGIYVNAAKVPRAVLSSGDVVQLGNLTLKYSRPSPESSTAAAAEFPWVEQQQLLLSLVQTLNSSLVLSQVLEQVLDAVLRITRADRGFLLLAEESADDASYESVAGLRLRVARRRGEPFPLTESQGISRSVVRRALESGQIVATGNAVADPTLRLAQSVILMDLRTIVCIPLSSPRAGPGGGAASVLGALYVDNQETSAPFSPESLKTAEALARHAALAIENARLFEREQRTIRELRDAQKQLLQSEKLATIGRMAAGLAHELNTPLTYIMGNLELLHAHPLSPAQQDMLGSIAKGADRIKSLTRSLLAFSRVSPEDMVPVDPNDVIERSLELCHYQVLKSGVHLEKSLTAGLPPVKVVSNQLEMALINLVVNAVQAMEGLLGGQLRVTSALRDARVEITVADTGPGIPESVQPTIFEPFFTTKPEGQGTGLGLSTVLMVVERHQGTIDYTTQNGVGTTFRISLPAAVPVSVRA
jgi:two-component system, NtrC family, sensor kinase